MLKQIAGFKAPNNIAAMYYESKIIEIISLTEYIQDMRIKKAKEMLLNSNWDIKKTAQEVGYKLHGSFSELFKRETGFTPKEFRNQIF